MYEYGTQAFFPYREGGVIAEKLRIFQNFINVHSGADKALTSVASDVTMISLLKDLSVKHTLKPRKWVTGQIQ